MKTLSAAIVFFVFCMVFFLAGWNISGRVPKSPAIAWDLYMDSQERSRQDIQIALKQYIEGKY
jgi:hypothetical protein